MKYAIYILGSLLLFTACQSFTNDENVDLNGDGKGDEIEWSFNQETMEYLLSINNIALAGVGSNLEGKYRVVDIDVADPYKEIAIVDFGASDDYTTEFFYYDGEDIKSMGVIEGRLNDTLILDGYGSIQAYKVRGKILDTWFYERNYGLNENRTLRDPEILYVPLSEQVTLYERNTPVVLLHDFTPQKSPEDASIAFTLQKGDAATIVACDDIKWCSIQNSEGQMAWFAVEGFNQILGTDFYSGDLFEGLSFAD